MNMSLYCKSTRNFTRTSTFCSRSNNFQIYSGTSTYIHWNIDWYLHQSSMDDCTVTHIGDRRGATWGSCPPPWNLKMMTSYAVLVENNLKFSLAPSALASNTLKFCLISFAPSARRKMGHFCQSARFCPPPSGKIPAGAHEILALFLVF